MPCLVIRDEGINCLQAGICFAVRGGIPHIKENVQRTASRRTKFCSRDAVAKRPTYPDAAH